MTKLVNTIPHKEIDLFATEVSQRIFALAKNDLATQAEILSTKAHSANQQFFRNNGVIVPEDFIALQPSEIQKQASDINGFYNEDDFTQLIAAKLRAAYKPLSTTSRNILSELITTQDSTFASTLAQTAYNATKGHDTEVGLKHTFEEDVYIPNTDHHVRGVTPVLYQQIWIKGGKNYVFLPTDPLLSNALLLDSIASYVQQQTPEVQQNTATTSGYAALIAGQKGSASLHF